jgi:FKBP-type peptidyl-prolyl cis-trans isomerase FkpA
MSTKAPLPIKEDLPMYALGVNLASQVGSQFLDVVDNKHEMDLLIAGFADTMNDATAEDPQKILQENGPALNEILTARKAALVAKSAASSVAFFDEFMAANPTAIKTPSGLVYLPTVEGTGKTPEPTNTVEVHYHGQLTDGKVFDSSVDRGETITFPLGNVIKGWQEGLAMMKEGGKATLVVPADLAYGEQGSPPVIAPGATLKFEVELFKVQ